MHFDDDGSHFLQLAAPIARYGRALRVTMDGVGVAHHWGDLMAKQTSYGAFEGNAIRPYIFAPISTTGLSTALSHSSSFDPSS